jgi:hypothetical protein
MNAFLVAQRWYIRTRYYLHSHPYVPFIVIIRHHILTSLLSCNTIHNHFTYLSFSFSHYYWRYTASGLMDIKLISVQHNLHSRSQKCFRDQNTLVFPCIERYEFSARGRAPTDRHAYSHREDCRGSRNRNSLDCFAIYEQCLNYVVTEVDTAWEMRGLTIQQIWTMFFALIF